MHERSATWRWTCVVVALGLLVALAPLAAAEVPGVPAGSSAQALRSDVVTPIAKTGPTLYERNLVWWPYATGPYYGDTPAAAMRGDDVIVTDVGSFQITEKLDLPAPLTADLAALNRGLKQHFIVQLRRAALAEQPYIETLLSLGAEIVDHMAVNAIVLRLDKAAYDLVLASPMVQFIEPYHPAYKIDAGIGGKPQISEADAANPRVNLDVRLFLGEPVAPVAELASRLGANVRVAVDIPGSPGALELDIDPARIPDLARIESVQHMSEQGPILIQGNYGIVTVQTGGTIDGDYPFWKDGLQGDGQIIQVTDTGVNVSAGHLAHTRSSSGWTGSGGSAGTNVIADHRKVVAYTAASKYNVGANSDITNCDADGEPLHGQLVVGNALGHATRGRTPAPNAPSPTDDVSTNLNATYGTSRPGGPVDYGAAFWQDGDANKIFSDSLAGIDSGYDGLAKGARLVFVDAQASCPETEIVNPGNLTNIINNTWSGTGNYKATVHNFSLGPNPSATTGPAYAGGATQIDASVTANPIAFVAVSVGNNGSVTGNNPGSSANNGTATDWAACKNCTAVGASYFGQMIDTTSEGPGPGAGGTNPTKRHVVHVFANGGDSTCRNTTNDNTTAPNCAFFFSFEGSSLATGYISGAAAVMREYFAEGFYPDGTDINADNASEKAPAISSTLIRALMIAGTTPIAGGKTYNGDYRFGHVWGYGDFSLNRALPLASFFDKTVSGLIVHDRPGNIDGQGGDDGVPSFFSPALPDTAPTAGNRASGEFVVTDTREDLAAVLTWLDPSTAANIADDLDLELTWCGADNDCATTADNVTWISNMFTDDNDQDGTFSETGAVDMLADGKVTGWWYSMSETDVTSRGGTIANYRWKYDNTEAVFLPTFRQAILSEDDNRDGTPDNKFLEYRNGTETGCPAGALGPDHCARTGKWRVTVFRNTGTTANLRYAVAVAGPVVAQSKVVIDKNPLTCNDEATVTIYETPDATDPSCKAANNCPLATIQSRTTLKVKNAAGATLDSETNLTVRQRFANQMIYEVRPPVPLSRLVAATPGDGVLTVQSGQFVVAEYADVKTATTNVRSARTTVDCQAKIDVFRVDQLGPDLPFTLGGGCDGDGYLDAQESFTILYQYTNRDEVTLYDAKVSFAVKDPVTGNPVPWVTVVDPQKDIGTLFFGNTQVSSFAFSVTGVPPGRQKVRLEVCISSTQSGQDDPTNEACYPADAVMQADDEKLFFITDCPTGCTMDFDRNFDENYENTIAVNLDDLADARRRNLDETGVVYGNLTVAGTCPGGGCGNPGFNGPWSFDTDREGFRSGSTPLSRLRDAAANQVTNWGEDLNYDDVLQALEEDRDPLGVAGQLDRNWGNGGGCGWMSKASGATAGGVWHTGKVGTWVAAHATQVCNPGGTPDPRPDDNDCERYDVHDGTQGELGWQENLRTPTVHPVNFEDPGDVLGWKTRILDWSWNMQWDASDPFLSWGQEFDLDTVGVNDPVTLGDDGAYAWNFGFGFNYGLLRGGQINIYGGAFAFANTDTLTGTGAGDEVVTTKGGNRTGRRGCYFNDLAGEDLGIDGAGLTAADRLVRTAFPIDDECDNQYDLGPNGCPGNCGVDDDGNGLVDDLREICPCKVCNAGPRVNQSCTSSAECNPIPPAAGRGNICVTATDPNGLPTNHWGDDVCGVPDQRIWPGQPARGVDVGVSEVWGDDGVGGYPLPTQRQTRGRTFTVNGQNLYINTLEDYVGPAGKDWAAEVMFIVSEKPGQPPPVRSYGMAIDDMVIEWQESRPVAQVATNTCSTASPIYGNEGECAQIFVGTIFNTTTGDTIIPVSVLDTFPNGNLVNCGPGGEQGVQVLVNSFAERGEVFCLLPVAPGATEYVGNVKTSTRVKQFGDGYTYISFNGSQTPAITVNYIDRDDKVHPYNQGADNLPGIGGFDDDGDGTIDNAAEWCPTKTQLGPGRSPHRLGQKARYSDDNCGCLDNPLQVTVSSFFDVADVVLTDVRVWDDTDAGRGTDGDNDGFADPDETIALSVTIRNQSEFPIKNLKLKLSSDSSLVKWFIVDELSLPTLGKNDPPNSTNANQIDTAALGTPLYFKFVAAPANRTDLFQDLSSLFTVSLSGTAVAGTDSYQADGTPLLIDVPIFGTSVTQSFKVIHNLDQAGSRAADYSQNFEGHTADSTIICPVYGSSASCDAPPASVEFIKRVTGDDVAELRGTYCQDSDPFNPQSPRSNPSLYCELGNGYSNAITENYWHLHGNSPGNCGQTAGCPSISNERGSSRGTGRRSLGSSKFQTTSGFPIIDNNLTSTVNRMYWVETKDAFQLGTGKTLGTAGSFGRVPQACSAAPCTGAEDQAPVLEYWTQLSILDHRLVSNSFPPEAFEAALVYACVDTDADNACDTKEDGAGADNEKWEPIRAYVSPESEFRDPGGCMFDPSDDGSLSSDFFEGSALYGPSSTCYPLAVDGCIGTTMDPSATNPYRSITTSCWPETGLEGQEGSPTGENYGPGHWIRKAHSLKQFRGQRVLFRWHVSPASFASIGTCASFFTQGVCANRDDGWYIDDIKVYGLASGAQPGVDNTVETPAPIRPATVAGLVARLGAISGNERSDEDFKPKPAAACSDTTAVTYCDFDEDGTLDKKPDGSDVTNTVTSGAPGQPYVLSAIETTISSCLGGGLEFRVETGTGEVIRDWVTNTEDVRVAPTATTTYVLKARCNADINTVSTASIIVIVPGGCQITVESLRLPSLTNKSLLEWLGSGTFDVAKGDVATLLGAGGNFGGASCLENNSPDTSSSDAITPPNGTAFYYLARCDGGTWNDSKQTGNRDSSLTTCP